MHYLLAAQALDMARERRLDPHHIHAVELDRLRHARRRTVRYWAAMTLTRLSLASAAAVRRLDGCVADDLSRRLAPSDGR
jgi:hypothetical protein